MCKFNPKNNSRFMDHCMGDRINGINSIIDVAKFEIVACCCGHGKYPMTIIIKGFEEQVFDMISGIDIPRKKKFYKKDKQGHYYIPEVMSVKYG